VILLIGCAYSAFWITALYEWNWGECHRQGELTKEQFEQECPVLKLVFGWWNFRPFEDKYEDRAIHPGLFIKRKIIIHSAIGGLMIIFGLVGFAHQMIRKKIGSEPGSCGYASPRRVCAPHR
jgi:hypothetical protein